MQTSFQSIALIVTAIIAASATHAASPPPSPNPSLERSRSLGSMTLKDMYPERFHKILIHPKATEHTQTYRSVPKGGNSGVVEGKFHDKNDRHKTTYAIAFRDGMVEKERLVHNRMKSTDDENGSTSGHGK